MRRDERWELRAAVALFLAAVATTLLISVREPWVEALISIPVLLLGVLAALRRGWPTAPVGILLVAIAVYGFAQLSLGTTLDRPPTIAASVRLATLAAAAVCAHAVFRTERLRAIFLRAFAWLGFAVGVVAVLAYYTSPNQILWLFPSPYPDTWGPFLSRNNFAQFLELTLPVALWFAIRERSPKYAVLAAVILAAGLVSASRAGAILLLAECVALWLLLLRGGGSRSKIVWYFAATAAGCAALGGASTLLGRVFGAHPLEYRREITNSTWSMIRERPWHGSGLGTFASVYPAHATFDTGRVVDHAHNDWLEFAVEGGWLYAVLWAALLLAVVSPAVRTGWGIGLLAVCLHALVDYPFARLGVSIWAFILLGAIETSRSHAPLSFWTQGDKL